MNTENYSVTNAARRVTEYLALMQPAQPFNNSHSLIRAGQYHRLRTAIRALALELGQGDGQFISAADIYRIDQEIDSCDFSPRPSDRSPIFSDRENFGCE